MQAPDARQKIQEILSDHEKTKECIRVYEEFKIEYDNRMKKKYNYAEQKDGGESGRVRRGSISFLDKNKEDIDHLPIRNLHSPIRTYPKIKDKLSSFDELKGQAYNYNKKNMNNFVNQLNKQEQLRDS